MKEDIERKPRMNGYTTITARVPKDLADHVRKLCFSMSKQEGRLVTTSELVRNFLKELCPVEKQASFFTTEKKRRLRRI
jgi:hypothetical protein